LSEPKYLNNTARVADVNLSLLQVYRSFKTGALAFESQLKTLETEFKAHADQGDALEYFLARRDEFNVLKHRPGSRKTLTKPEKARLSALFIFLNKAGFNGLYRESQNGNFNVPFGKKQSVLLYDESNFKAIKAVLKRTQVSSGSYIKLIKSPKDAPIRGDLVYFDPPYEPLTPTSSFTNYSHSGFTIDDQRELAAQAIKLAKRGCKVVISNSSAAHLKPIYWAYAGFKIYEVQATRLVSAKASSRLPVKEIIVTNFDVTTPGLKLVPRPRMQ
jgi:DNA adenine methylase